MKPIRIFQHLDCEGPAHFQTILEKRNIPFELVRVDQGDAVLNDLDNIAGLIFMGGPMSVNDPLDWIEAEVTLIQAAMKQIPPMGVTAPSQRAPVMAST